MDKYKSIQHSHVELHGLLVIDINKPTEDRMLNIPTRNINFPIPRGRVGYKRTFHAVTEENNGSTECFWTWDYVERPPLNIKTQFLVWNFNKDNYDIYSRNRQGIKRLSCRGDDLLSWEIEFFAAVFGQWKTVRFLNIKKLVKNIDLSSLNKKRKKRETINRRYEGLKNWNNMDTIINRVNKY